MPARYMQTEGMPKIWVGSQVKGWIGLLRRNSWAISPRHLPWSALITVHTVYNSAAAALQDHLFGAATRSTNLVSHPVFIIGHWRSGTTWLHEMLALDAHHTFPTTYACVFPGHFLLTERSMSRLWRRAMPARRPMDNMAMGWDRPQEDEFALCNLGQPSPYLSFAFPNRPQQHCEYFDLEGIPAAARDRWKETFLRFLTQLTLREPKRLILKSPTHTYRIRILLELFPEARFIHIVRDPQVVLPSTLHTWRVLSAVLGLQNPDFNRLEQQVFGNYVKMFTRLAQTRALVPPNQFYQVRYEDLARDPVGEVCRMYRHLELGDVAAVRPRLQEYIDRNSSYRTNRYTVPEQLRDTIRERAAGVIQEYGYA
jgi:omega-hydroxy-beta-dihydromenaquinone-9 sulfotransferase